MKIKQEERASSVEDWEEYYGSRGDAMFNSVNINDFRNLPHKILIDKVDEFINRGESSRNKSVIEIGAGDSDLLIDICQRFMPKEVYGLDYLESACERLEKKSKQAGANVKTVCADIFNPPNELLKRFDFVMSYGVVEHFHDLPNVLKSIGKFSKDDGYVLTLIPNNKNTIYGYLMRQWNMEVYNSHVMYDKHDLETAHKEANLEIVWCDYLVSSNFGMLSWCFKDKSNGISFWLYKQLTRVSKLIWFIETKTKLFKPSRFFSPYIVCVSSPKP